MSKIHKEVYGQGQPVVLIHGWAMHTGIWRGFAEQLAQQHQVICVDLPGHGLSETVEPYTLDEICESLIEVLPVPPFSVVGWSLGASVALCMAKKFPKRINSLTLLAGNPKFVQDYDWAGMQPKVLDDFGSELQLNCARTLLRFLVLQVNNLPNSKALLQQLKQALQECEPPSETVLQGGLDILKYQDLRADLTSLSCPVKIIQGDKDSLVPVQTSQDIQKILPSCSVGIISGAGHVPFLSHQSQVIELLNRFI